VIREAGARDQETSRGEDGGVIANSPEAWTARAQAPLSHEAAMWSQEGQRARFDAVLAALNPQPSEVLLDYGCGTGLLSTFIHEGVGYMGYDWSHGMVERARHDHPMSAFVSEDLVPVTPDLVACIGCFNLQDRWSKQQTWDVLTHLWGRCRRAMAVCLYAGDDPDCITYLDSDCIAFSKSTHARWSVARHRHNDLLLLLERPH